ncbi:MAG: Fe-S-containing hydro-lyase [Bacillota bacterium]|nr:Fe-S-containing hydro-lyase [Bacillota bacterium]
MEYHLTAPLSKAQAALLRAGDKVLLSGYIYTARDAAHKRLCELLDAGRPLPIELAGAVIYYAGPTPARPGRPIGSIGPTTAYRMDKFTPRLLGLGMLGMIGKGDRSDEVIAAIKQAGAVYFGATGGAAALLARAVRGAQTVAFAEYGAEQISRLEISEMPLTVVIDSLGNDLYKTGPKSYLQTIDTAE